PMLMVLLWENALRLMNGIATPAASKERRVSFIVSPLALALLSGTKEHASDFGICRKLICRAGTNASPVNKNHAFVCDHERLVGVLLNHRDRGTTGVDCRDIVEQCIGGFRGKPS